MFDQRGELPLLPFGNPIGFVPASRGGVYIESINHSNPPSLFGLFVSPKMDVNRTKYGHVRMYLKANDSWLRHPVDSHGLVLSAVI